MNKPVLTTKKTSTGYFVGSLFGDIIFAALGVFFSQKADALRSYWRADDAKTMRLAATVCFIVALLSFLYHLMVSATYADVHNGRIVGKGLQNITMKSFDLRFDQITDISDSKGLLNLESGGGVFIIVNTSAGSYKIMTTPDCARRIIEFYHKAKVGQA